MPRHKSTTNTRVRQPVSPGDRFGRLTVIAELPIGSYCPRMVSCRCDCGAIVECVLKTIRSGNTSSCGCLRREMVAAKNTKHGCRKRSGDSHPEYKIWKQMRQRCNNPRSGKWGQYGGRGIKVCSRWNDFLAFLEDVGPRPSVQHSIDRIDNDKDYEPGNVRWATPFEQANNKQKTKRFLWNGEQYTIGELSRMSGLPYMRISWRLAHGWSVERAVTERPSKGRNQYGSPRSA